ncbi:MAG: hypothetical protein HYW02_04720, partial [Deltaproteobacteria bacterium]|nr:hypothetical protein [Deltaproteobacteria bacterium]
EQYSGAWETACTGEDSCDSSSIEATYYSVVNGGINCGTSVSDCRDEFQHMKQTIDAKGLNYFKGSGGGFDTKIFEQVGAAIEAVAACSTCTFTASTLDQFIPTAATIGQASVQSCLDQAIRNRTDPRDCYTSGNSVAGGGGSSQTSSAFTTLLSGITNAGALSCDTSNCYYISNILSTTDGALCKVSLDGSSSSCLVTGLNKPKALSLTGTKACWVLFNTGTIYCISKTGGAITTVVTGTNEHLGMSNGFVNDGTNFYWGNAGEPMGQIYSVPVTTVNGDDTAISSGLSLTNLSTPLIRSNGLSGSTLFFDHTLVNSQFTRVSQISTSGGSPTLLATTSSQIQAIASDGTTFCWTEGSDTGSDRAASCKPVGGGTTTTYLSNSSASVGGLGLSGGFLYFSLLSSDGRSIMKCATSGSTCTTHASGLTGSLRWSNFVGDSMFFVESSGSQQTPGPSTIKKVAK